MALYMGNWSYFSPLQVELWAPVTGDGAYYQLVIYHINK